MTMIEALLASIFLYVCAGFAVTVVLRILAFFNHIFVTWLYGKHD